MNDYTAMTRDMSCLYGDMRDALEMHQRSYSFPFATIEFSSQPYSVSRV